MLLDKGLKCEGLNRWSCSIVSQGWQGCSKATHVPTHIYYKTAIPGHKPLAVAAFLSVSLLIQGILDDIMLQLTWSLGDLIPIGRPVVRLNAGAITLLIYLCRFSNTSL